MYQSILVPVDGSEHSAKALGVAAQLARGSSASLTLMTVAGYPPGNMGLFTGGTPEPFTSENWNEIADSLKADAQQALKTVQDSVDLSGIEVETLVRQGTPAEGILKEAEQRGVDVIVMGSRGVSDMHGMIFGSTSHKVSHVAPCTVITVA
ncbi:universal stress protein [Halomonas organivorans]|uniref:Nucleotide-binding universal stress UspA family protein n=1 Tax=Halomonas organivorans TaxID=257772 RepID=A0A7W5G6L2_9GAMM|nr:universal stress protein [Halomonas organivorans]MBB3141606.1 nucleotide-binding universal stress UspA family protein [Halomonas organivorans]